MPPPSRTYYMLYYNREDYPVTVLDKTNELVFYKPFNTDHVLHLPIQEFEDTYFDKPLPDTLRPVNVNDIKADAVLYSRATGKQFKVRYVSVKWEDPNDKVVVLDSEDGRVAVPFDILYHHGLIERTLIHTVHNRLTKPQFDELELTRACNDNNSTFNIITDSLTGSVVIVAAPFKYKGLLTPYHAMRLFEMCKERAYAQVLKYVLDHLTEVPYEFVSVVLKASNNRKINIKLSDYFIY